MRLPIWLTMLFDHPPLDPFEPLIRELLDCAFGDALTGLAAAGLNQGMNGIRRRGAFSGWRVYPASEKPSRW